MTDNVKPDSSLDTIARMFLGLVANGATEIAHPLDVDTKAFLESLCREFHHQAGQQRLDYWSRRIALARYCGGYLDSKFIVLQMFSTLGFPLEESAAWAAQHDLALDLSSIHHELKMLGMSDNSATLQLETMKKAHEEMTRLRTSRAGDH